MKLINKAGEIKSLDGDSYSSTMEISEYEIVDDDTGVPFMICYYESTWRQ